MINKLHKDYLNEKEILYETFDENIINVLREVKNKGIKNGMISNCFIDDIYGFNNSRIAKLFDDIVLSCDVGILKPNSKNGNYQKMIEQIILIFLR